MTLDDENRLGPHEAGPHAGEPHNSGDGLVVVGIGASAGGLEAFHGFFSNMPEDGGMAFVVVLHLPANRRSLLAEILSRWTTMAVREVEGDTELEPNTVYVPPPHASTVLRNGKLRVSVPPADHPRDFRPIDGLFDSLASSLGERAVGIVLSGTGSDGALGLKAIRTCGGLTIAQAFGDTPDDRSPHHHNDMPAGAIATGAVELVLPVEEMPAQLMRLRAGRPDLLQAALPDEDVEAERLRICAVLRARMGHDFGNYKPKTFLRRVGRRMLVVGVPTLAAYADYLDENDAEPKLLFRDLLIRVTAFFRDNEAFDAIEQLVMPRLFAGRTAENTVRVWVAGCSTGEEAYSLAILLREQMDKMRGAPRVRIFATDIDDPAIATARLGRYPAVLLEGISAERRARFFTQSDSGFVVAKEIRDLCTFSAHSLVRDPPFSRIDLVSCRNLLIYMDADLQAKVIPAFHYALSPGGMLILGISESASRHDNLFTPLDKSARIFSCRDVRSPPIEVNGRVVRRLSLPERKPARVRTAQPPFSLPGAMLKEAPPPPSPSDTLRAFARRAEVALGGLLSTSALRPRRPAALEAELRNTTDELQSVREEHETVVEELRSANEELHSVNEELQSTNEELETSKEEIQSVNEELHTVNAQLQEKVDELDRVNSDLKNLFDSTQIATVFLDRFIIVRGFTPAISGIYNLIPSDTGRPLTDIVSRLRYDTLREDVESVLATLTPIERQVSCLEGQTHFILRILPYRGSNSVVSGTLVTFLEVTSVVRAEQHQRLLVDELNHRVKNMLTVVISLASQTLRRSDDLETFREAFMGRVHALSASYTLLSRENWVSIDLRDVIQEEIKPFTLQDGSCVDLDGPSVQLLPSAALALGMAIHELATNAAKYGALSQPEGGVSVRWCIDAEDSAQPELKLRWQEQGGPVVVKPQHTGFGTMLIQRGLSYELGGGAEIDFNPDGVCATLHANLSRAAYRPNGHLNLA